MVEKSQEYCQENYQIKDGVLLRYTGREEEIAVVGGIHTVGESAFKGCVSLKKVTLPPGLQRIMGDAFKGCRRLEEIEIPDGVTYIGSYAFHRCHALRRVILPRSVEELGECAFLYCDSVREAWLPGVKRMGMAALANGISLEKLVISRELEEHCICDVFTGCGRVREIAFAGSCETGEERSGQADCHADVETFCIPNLVEVVAGACKVPHLIELVVRDILERMMELEGRTLVRFRVNIKHIEVPEGIEVLAKSSFYDMRGIVDIKLPRTLTKIESRAFRNCIGLEQVVLGGDAVLIDADAFRNCTALKSVRTCDGKEYTFEGLNDIYRTDAAHLAGHSGTEEVSAVTDQTRKIVTSGAVPEIVREIHRQVYGNFRLSGTILLKYLGAESRVVVPEGVTAIAEEAFADIETIDRVILPESLRAIGAEAFRGCLMMQTIVLPEGLCRLGSGAFSNCVKLLRVRIPKQVDVLADKVFCNCRALQEVQLPECLRRIGESAFYGCASLKKIQLSESLTHIGKLAFYRAGLKEVRIPAKAEEVESLAFAKSAVQRVWISGGCGTGKQYGADVFGGCAKLRTLVLEEGVRHIPDRFAYGCASLARVVLPVSLESVGRHALEGTEFLAQWKLRMADRSGKDNEEAHRDTVLWDGQHLAGEVWISGKVQIIAGGAFYGNTAITEVHLPAQVRSVGAAAFKGCSSLRRVYLPAGMKCLEEEVFSGCAALERVLESTADGAQPPLWRRIGARAFYQCARLDRLWLDQVETVGKEALSGCVALASCAVNPALRAGERAFADTMLGERLANGLHLVGGLVVSGTDCAGEICLPEAVRGIAPYAFAGNRGVSRIVFPERLSWIGEGAFFGCSALERAVFSDGQRACAKESMPGGAVAPDRLLKIDACAFEKCVSLAEVVCPVHQAGESAFAGCVSLVRAELPNLELFEKRMFAGCADLESCLGEKVQVVREYCFSGCKRLHQFDFSRIRQIGEYAFAGCERLDSVEFQDGTCLDAHALEDCCGLEKICLSGGQGTVCLREYALSGCTLLRAVRYQEKDWTLHCYRDILSEDIPEMVRLLFHSAFSCFTIEQEEQLVRYRGTAGTVRIPDGIRRIAAEVFRDAMMLERVEIPESVEYIGARAFHGTPWMAHKRQEAGQESERLSGSRTAAPLVIVRDMLLDGAACAGEVVVPAGIRLVCGWAFANGLDITGIHFAAAGERQKDVQVEEYAFRNCINLQKMTLPDGAVVRFSGIADRERELPPLAKQAVMDSLNCFKTDESGVLKECTGNISRLRLAQGITAIGEGTFQDGNLLTTVTLSETVAGIGARAFAGCKWLCAVRQADSVIRIGAHAFSGCGMLRCVELSENLRQIGAHAFENCTALEELLIPEGVEEIPERAFYRCHSLKNIKLPSTLKTIGREAFAFCKGASRLQVSEGVQVGERAFYGA